MAVRAFDLSASAPARVVEPAPGRAQRRRSRRRWSLIALLALAAPFAAALAVLGATH